MLAKDNMLFTSHASGPDGKGVGQELLELGVSPHPALVETRVPQVCLRTECWTRN